MKEATAEKDPKKHIPNLVKLLEKAGAVTCSNARTEQRFATAGQTHDLEVNGKQIGSLHITDDASVILYHGKVLTEVPLAEQAKKSFYDPNHNEVMLLAEKSNGKYVRGESRFWIQFP